MVRMDGWFEEDIITLNEGLIPCHKNMSPHLKAVFSAVVSAVLVAVFGYITTLTDIWALSVHQVVNIAVFAAVASLLKYVGTTEKGNFAGAIPVK